jgi:hypothetical protein
MTVCRRFAVRSTSAAVPHQGQGRVAATEPRRCRSARQRRAPRERGELWRRARLPHKPAYAGAFVFCRSRTHKRLDDHGRLQGIVRCAGCGRRMQVAYSGNGCHVTRHACVRSHHLHGTDHACQSLGGLRFEKAIAKAFLGP